MLADYKILKRGQQAIQGELDRIYNLASRGDHNLSNARFEAVMQPLMDQLIDPGMRKLQQQVERMETHLGRIAEAYAQDAKKPCEDVLMAIAEFLSAFDRSKKEYFLTKAMSVRSAKIATNKMINGLRSRLECTQDGKQTQDGE